jgi:hypothetical protein
MIRRRKYNEKDVVINFSVLSYFLLRGGGGQEPGIENPEVPADVLQEADKTSKTSTVVLGIGFAVLLLANVGLGWKLWKKPPAEAYLNKETDAVARTKEAEVQTDGHLDAIIMANRQLNMQNQRLRDQFASAILARVRVIEDNWQLLSNEIIRRLQNLEENVRKS